LTSIDVGSWVMPTMALVFEEAAGAADGAGFAAAGDADA
jgi:hypothetical protein